jgi:hypothetical protein
MSISFVKRERRLVGQCLDLGEDSPDRLCGGLVFEIRQPAGKDVRIASTTPAFQIKLRPDVRRQGWDLNARRPTKRGSRSRRQFPHKVNQIATNARPNRRTAPCAGGANLLKTTLHLLDVRSGNRGVMMEEIVGNIFHHPDILRVSLQVRKKVGKGLAHPFLSGEKGACGLREKFSS